MGRIFIKFHPPDRIFFHEAQRPGVSGGKRVESVGVVLLDIACTVDDTGAHGDDALCQRIERNRDRIQDVLGSIGRQRGRGAHGAGEDHRLARLQHRLQEPGRLLQGIGPVGDDDPFDGGVRQPMGAPQREFAPDGKTHVLAVDLRHLLGHQIAFAQHQ